MQEPPDTEAIEGESAGRALDKGRKPFGRMLTYVSVLLLIGVVVVALSQLWNAGAQHSQTGKGPAPQSAGQENR